MYEEKYDGYRMLAHKDGAQVRLISRNLKDPDSIYTPDARTTKWIKVKHKVRIGWPGEGTEYTRG